MFNKVYTLEKEKTLREEVYLDVSTFCRFKHIVHYRDLPYVFDLEKLELLRYPAYFYGHDFNKHYRRHNL